MLSVAGCATQDVDTGNTDPTLTTPGPDTALYLDTAGSPISTTPESTSRHVAPHDNTAGTPDGEASSSLTRQSDLITARESEGRVHHHFLLPDAIDPPVWQAMLYFESEPQSTEPLASASLLAPTRPAWPHGPIPAYPPASGANGEPQATALTEVSSDDTSASDEPTLVDNQAETAAVDAPNWVIPDTHLLTTTDPDRSSVEAPAPGDIWDRLRKGFRLSGHNHPRIQPHIDWYARNQAYLDRVVERARPFLYEIVEQIEGNDIPLEIALLPVVESAFQPFAYSPGRAAGIWQFIPGTGRRYGLKQNWWYDGRRDVPNATRAAITYLSELRERFNGDWLLALAAYNSGEGRVMRAQRKNRSKGLGEDFWSLDLPNETKDYVPKLLAISTIVENSANYGVTLAPIPDEPYLSHIDIGSQIDLALAAELADLPIETIYTLNPAFNRWATDPKGPHVLSLPVAKAAEFRTALTSVESRIQWQRHRIRQGETLGEIAEQYQTSVKLLQQVNNIRDKWIRAGDNIIIPVSTKNLTHYLSEDQRRLAKQNATRKGTKIHHTVAKGDTLWDLSRHYNVSVGKLASWNAMAPRDTLMPGQRLVIWTSTHPNMSTKFAVPPSNQTQQRLQYRVRKGDSLARIAKKFRVTVANLRNWNSLPKGKYLQPGQRLTLYVDVTRQS